MDRYLPCRQRLGWRAALGSHQRGVDTVANSPRWANGETGPSRRARLRQKGVLWPTCSAVRPRSPLSPRCFRCQEGWPRRHSTSWSMGGHDFSNTRDNPDQKTVDAGDVGTLATKWTFTTHGDVSATPGRRRWCGLLPGLGRLHQQGRRQDRKPDLAEEALRLRLQRQPDLVSRTARRWSGTWSTSATRAVEERIPQPGRVLAISAKNGDLLWSSVINSNVRSRSSPSPRSLTTASSTSAPRRRRRTRPLHPRLRLLHFRGSFSALGREDRARSSWTTYTVPAATGCRRPATPAAPSGAATPALDTKHRIPSTSRPATTTASRPSAKTCQDDGGTPARLPRPD